MFSTFRPEDVTLLLKDITGMVEPQPAQVRERLIQSGVHYCEMLPQEYRPSPRYMETYERALHMYAGITAQAVASVAEQILREKGEKAVLVSLARAGTAIGVLIKRYIREKYHTELVHYSISIIRGRGIDKNAMDHILAMHSPESIRFVDGWTGKGAIQNQLIAAMADYPGVDPGLAVLSDPARIATVCGTHDDFLIAGSCLNATVSGLLSRTFLRSDIIGPNDFHGAAFYSELMAEDVTEQYLSTIEAAFPKNFMVEKELPDDAPMTALQEVEDIRRAFGVRDINFVKPGIGEATRVLLRRMPWKILVHRLDDEDHLGHLYRLAEEKQIELVQYPLIHYRACGIIKDMADT